MTQQSPVLETQPMTSCSIETPEDTKEMCIERLRSDLNRAKRCLETFNLVSTIPRRIVLGIEDSLMTVFGPMSKEVIRFLEYKDSHNSIDKDTRRDWLRKAISDLELAIDRIQAMSISRFSALKLGAIENENYVPCDVQKELGLEYGSSVFSARIRNLSQRIEICMKLDYMDAAGFYTRKIIEQSLIEKYRNAKKVEHIMIDGKFLELSKIISRAGSDGFISQKVVEKLLQEKLFMDSSVHVLLYEPSITEFGRILSVMRIMYAELKREDDS